MARGELRDALDFLFSLGYIETIESPDVTPDALTNLDYFIRLTEKGRTEFGNVEFQFQKGINCFLISSGKIDINNLRSILEKKGIRTSSYEKITGPSPIFEAILNLVPGLTYWNRDQVDVFKTQEIDLAFFNEKYIFLPNVLLVESKNWLEPVGNTEMNWFDSKIRLGGLDLGIFVAANGVTGDNESLTGSHGIIRAALQDKRRLIVITLDDFRSISRPNQIIELIKRKLCDLHVRHTSLL